jgi:hypothetical protein
MTNVFVAPPWNMEYRFVREFGTAQEAVEFVQTAKGYQCYEGHVWLVKEYFGDGGSSEQMFGWE